MKYWIAFLIVISTSVVAEAKALQWQEGKVTGVSEEWNLQHGDYDKGTTYAIQNATYVYTVTEFSMSHHRLKDKRAEVNDTVRFALKGKGETGLVLIGKDGKQYRMMLRTSTKLTR